MTSFDTSKIKGQATGLDKRLFEDHNFLHTKLDDDGIDALADGLTPKTAGVSDANLNTEYSATDPNHATFLHEVIDELADGFDIPQEIKDEIITQAKNNLGNGATLNDMINEIVTILEAADDDTANEIDRDIILQQDVSNTETTKTGDTVIFSGQDFKTPTSLNTINDYIETQKDLSTTTADYKVKTGHTYKKENANIMTQGGGVIDLMAPEFSFSLDTKKRLLGEAIEVAGTSKKVSDVVTALATVLERYDNNATDTNDGNTPKDKALSRDTLIKNGLGNISFDGTRNTAPNLIEAKKNLRSLENALYPSNEKYEANNERKKEALYAGIHIIAPQLIGIDTKKKELKQALIDEAYSMGNPNGGNFTLGEMMDNIAKILERHDNDNNKGDVVHDDNGDLWASKNDNGDAKTIEQMAGVTSLAGLFNKFNPTNGQIKTADASTYFSNLLEELNTDSSGDKVDTTKIVSQGDLNKIIKDIAGTDGKMSDDEFRRIVQVMEVKSGQNISNNVKAGTSLTMTENGNGKITGSIADNDNQAAGFNIDTALGFTNVKGILDYLDADNDGNIVKSKAINFITDALKAANVSSTMNSNKIKALVNAITDKKTEDAEVVNAAELEKIMAFSEAISGKNLFDSVDGQGNIALVGGVYKTKTTAPKNYGTYNSNTKVFTDAPATASDDFLVLNHTVDAMFTGVNNRKNLGFSDNGYSERSSHILVESQNKEAILDTLRERIKNEVSSVNDDEAEIIIQAALANLQNARAAKGSTKGKFADITVGNLYREVENIMQGDSAEYESAVLTRDETPGIVRDFGSINKLYNKLLELSDSSLYLDPDVVKDFLIGYTKDRMIPNNPNAITTIKQLVDKLDGGSSETRSDSEIGKTDFNNILKELDTAIKAGTTANGFTPTETGLGLAIPFEPQQ